MTLLQPKQSNGGFPQGGWPYVDPKTGFKCNGWEGTPQMHAVKIIAHRRANPNFYPPSEGQWFDPASVVQEIYQQKVKTHPHLFKGYSDNAPQMNAQPTPKTMVSPTIVCACGSNEFEPQYCKTCGGNRINGYKCSKCGKDIKR